MPALLLIHMIIDHTHQKYIAQYNKLGKGRYNGAYYYSKEICENIIPRVQTDRNWVTIKVPDTACDHSIVFIHNNLHMEYYDYLKRYKDLILVCGIEETAEKLTHLGKTIVLPLSIDLDYVKQFERPKTKYLAYVGRKEKLRFGKIAQDADIIHGLPRHLLLPKMAEYKYVYAVGRTAIEAKALGCSILPYDKRFPDTEAWKIFDNRGAANILQTKLDEIEG